MAGLKGNKRGAFGHIEIMLSFLLFVGFLLFMFIIFSPIRKSNISEFDLDYTDKMLVERAGAELSYFTLSINESEVARIDRCFSFDFSIESGNKIYAENSSQGKVQASYGSGKIYINKSGRFYYIYSFPGIIEEPPTCGSFTDLNSNLIAYEIGAKKKINVLYEDNINSLNTSYYADYAGLKRELGFGNDFGFIVYDSLRSNVLWSVMRDRAGRAVFSRDKGYQLLYKDGKLRYIILNLQIW